MADAFAYGHAPYYAMLGNWNWTVTTITAGLFTSSYVPDIDAHTFVSDLSGEVSGGGYVQKTLVGKTLTYSSADNEVQASASQVSWTSLTATFRYAIFWADTGIPSSSVLLFYIDYGVDQNVTAGTWNIPVPTSGYLVATV